MATEYKVRFKNRVIPQEQIESGGKWFLDSEVGEAIGGEATFTHAANGSLTKGQAIGTSTTVLSVQDFIYIKNNGPSDILLCLSNSLFYIRLSEGEAFSSYLDTAVGTQSVKTESGRATIDYFECT
tara:strand:+ start:1228 stop:1605 length:378 start_codon:yes stop_codon:yes gene_type:complete